MVLSAKIGIGSIKKKAKIAIESSYGGAGSDHNSEIEYVYSPRIADGSTSTTACESAPIANTLPTRSVGIARRAHRRRLTTGRERATSDRVVGRTAAGPVFTPADYRLDRETVY